MIREKRLPEALIVKGKPIFRRHLYIASALFVVIIAITTYILINLATESLKDRITLQMSNFSMSQAEQIENKIQLLNARLAEAGAEAEAQRADEIKSFIEQLLAEHEELVYVFGQDLKGSILWKGIRAGMELEQNNFPKLLVSSRNSRPPELEVRSLSNSTNSITDWMEPIFSDDEPEVFVHFGFDNDLMERRYADYRAGVLGRILMGSSAVVGILLAALIYVLWLLKRAQLIEAEAHVADRLAYLGTLASGLAHEIRNPLSAMNLNLQMIEEDIAQGDFSSTEMGTLLRGTKEEIKRLDRLASNFLLYSRPMQLEKQQTSVGEILDEVTRLVQRECTAAGIRLTLRNGLEHLKIEADRDLIKQAILNLLVNAQDAVNAKVNGDREIVLAAHRAGDEVVISVIDSGVGIGTEESRNLFKLFYSSKRGGTGLGLPIAQRIIESHGGRIEWENRSAGGAEFRIRLAC